MRLLWREKVYGWWTVTGLVGKSANWFFGFSRKPPSPAQPIPPTTDPRTAGVLAPSPLKDWYDANPAPTMSMCATSADYWKAMYEHREAEAHQLGMEITRLERRLAAGLSAGRSDGA